MRSLIVVAALAFAGVAAQAASAQTPSSQASSSQGSTAQAPASPARTAADYVMKAGQSDAFEIQSGQLAASKAKRSDVQAFGAQMVKDHTKSTEMVLAAASKSGLPAPPPPALRLDQQDKLSQLQAATGEVFDSLYASQQLQAHEEALALHSAYAQGGDDANLKTVAAKIVPVVTQHLDMLRKGGAHAGH
jgi:putative membrane protein